MKVLVGIPHIFSPRAGSIYSSETASKQEAKEIALKKATINNICRHGRRHWIHASLGLHKQVITRELMGSIGVDLTVHIYTDSRKSLVNCIPKADNIKIFDCAIEDPRTMPLVASKHIIESAENYDIVGYMEDDILIEDPEFFFKIIFLTRETSNDYAFLPHRCEEIPNKGDVILSGDPDGGRPDLFWDTGETISVTWPLGMRKFYRATNPHSGCYFLNKAQGIKLRDYWQSKNWIADFTLSGPLEQAGSGLLLPIFKIMKPIPEHYRFLMVRHQDSLWERHPFEE
jgi:hypothetical protein